MNYFVELQSWLDPFIIITALAYCDRFGLIYFPLHGFGLCLTLGPDAARRAKRNRFAKKG